MYAQVKTSRKEYKFKWVISYCQDVFEETPPLLEAENAPEETEVDYCQILVELIKCVCHCRRAMFRVLGMYNFGGCTSKVTANPSKSDDKNVQEIFN